ncbi:hypothetical protein BD779DRAFT_1782752 [Infundibulicybe gibba]|nr:hypothetical protein BD779DRAFT_1782752 [Infundibulicybe gibba]
MKSHSPAILLWRRLLTMAYDAGEAIALGDRAMVPGSNSTTTLRHLVWRDGDPGTDDPVATSQHRGTVTKWPGVQWGITPRPIACWFLLSALRHTGEDPSQPGGKKYDGPNGDSLPVGGCAINDNTFNGLRGTVDVPFISTFWVLDSIVMSMTEC